MVAGLEDGGAGWSRLEVALGSWVAGGWGGVAAGCGWRRGGCSLFERFSFELATIPRQHR